jgi:hypothetical protein
MGLLSHRHRKHRLHVLTLDPVLAEDVCARLADDPRTRDAERIAPPGRRPTVADLEALAPDTVTSRLLILDVRSLTLPRLMVPYNRLIGYNRRDLNERVYSLLIGDGPPALFGPGGTFDVFAGLLARFRVDYHASGFFFDPFTHYSHEERSGLRLEGGGALPEGIPRRLAKWFKEGDRSVGEVRRYFRAASTPPEGRPKEKARRTEQLRSVLTERISEMAPGDEARLLPLLSPEGLRVQAEQLTIHVYPLFFEDRAARLLARAGKER